VDAVRTTIGVAKSMGISVQGQVVAVMVMFQESSIRNLANDGTSTQNASWPTPPGRDYWMNVTRLSLKYPHDKFGSRDGAHDTDSIGLYQQRPAYGWGNYGSSTGTTDPEGVVQRLLDPRWEAMAFFGGQQSAAPTSGLLDVRGWEGMAPTYAANAVQGSNYPEYYAQWEKPATDYVNGNQDAPAISLPWYPGGGGGALACTSIPTNAASGEGGRNPFGALDVAAIDGTGIRVTGWMIDPDAANGIGTIHFYDQGPFGTVGYPTGVANQQRDDVNRVYNVLGQYGFSTVIPWNGPGAHTICAYGINVGRGTGNPQLGCRDVSVPGPIGYLDQASRNEAGQIDVMGWAADPAVPAGSETVRISVTGPNGAQSVNTTTTGDPRPDVGSAFGWAGGRQGFHRTVPAMGPGDNRVCVNALNIKPPNSNPEIGCRTVTIPYPPVGFIDTVEVTGTTAVVSGWTFDPRLPNVSIPVHFYVDQPNGVTVGKAATANRPRPDVNNVYGISGEHGYTESVTLAPGTNQICAYGIGVDSNNNTQLGCRSVQAGPSAMALSVPEARIGPSGGTTTEPSSSAAPTIPGPATAGPTTPGSAATGTTTTSTTTTSAGTSGSTTAGSGTTGSSTTGSSPGSATAQSR
jgi:hypothetical protein